MDKRVVHTDKVPPARVPLSQAIRTGGWVFASGQLGMDPRTGRLVEGGIKAETRQVCENLKAALEAAGGTLDDVCRVDVYLRNIGDRERVNKVRRQFWRGTPPASTLVEVSKLASPEFLVEISAIALVSP